jgi:lactate dehydrogenase-like 2-hydroxyacid dehydrogenase
LKVLATRRYPGPAFDELGDVEVGPLEPSRDVEALIVANEPVDPAFFPSLRLVANFGVGYDRLGVKELRARGIAVTNTPGVLDAATADLTWALILAARRRVVEGDRRVRAGEWTGSWADGFLAEELTGSTLGIVGLGRIGTAVARRAEGFELRVVSVRSHDGDAALDELLAESDIVTIHAPLTPETRGLIDARRLGLLRAGGVFVNTSRGEIVDEEALVAELVSGRIRAGLDVFAHEPHVPEALVSCPNVVLTPHLGSATRQAREAMTRLVVDNIRACERGDDLLSPVRA